MKPLSAKMISRRAGAALMAVLVAIAVVSLLLVGIAQQIMTNRRFVERRQHQQQSLWLARSGQEIAVARLLADPDYAGESAQPIPLAQVRISVQRDKKLNSYQITSEARFPTDAASGVVRSITTRILRFAEKDKVRLEVVNSTP